MPSPENATANGNGAAPTEDGKFIDNIDPDDPDYQRELMRPAEIKEDVKLMEQRKRVSLILNSEAFKSELEEIIATQLRQGAHPASLLALQQISDLLLPQGKSGAQGAFSQGSTTPTIPINDIRGADVATFVKGEKLLRCKLAAVYRLVDFFGWTHGVYNHITARISKDHDHFLINPFGLLYNEVSASSLVKIDRSGEVIDRGGTVLGVNMAGWLLHAALHAARPDVRCIIHLHTPAAVAVSSLKAGLLPVSQEAMILGPVSYHDYHGIVTDEQEAQRLADDLGAENKVMILRNHGVVLCGESVEEAWYLTWNFVAAAEAQSRLGSLVAHPELLSIPDEDAQRAAHEIGKQGGGGVDHKSESGHHWRTGELEFEALMRHLDNAGYRTGYIYRQPIIKPDRRARRHEDVEVPPSSSSFTYYYDGDVAHSKYQSVHKMIAERNKQGVRTEWLNTPNTYHKEEIDEIGTPDPKKITKWVADQGDDKTSTPIKVAGANQFAVQGGDPKEFKNKQKEVKSAYYTDAKSAGPQSRVLEGLTQEEMSRMMEEGKAKQVGDKVFAVGAASKGIIQREHQHNAVVYHTAFAPNPFDKVTDDDLEEYRKEVERKNNPEAYQEAVLEAEAAREAAEREAEIAARPALKIAGGSHGESSTDVVKSEPGPKPGAATAVNVKYVEKDEPDADRDAVPAAVPVAGGKVQRHESDARVQRQQRQRQQEVSDVPRGKPVERSKSERQPVTERAQTLSPPGAAGTGTDTMRSDTSGAETHDEQRGDSPSKKKKDKKKKLFSFSKSDKKDKKAKAAAK